VSQNIKIKKYITVNLLVLYECKTWLLPLHKEQRLRAFKNRILRKMFGLKIRFPCPISRKEYISHLLNTRKRIYK
jgi:hypothetical protein